MLKAFIYKTENKDLPRFAFNFCGSATFFYTVKPGDDKIGVFNFKYECLDSSYRRVSYLAEVQELHAELENVMKKVDAKFTKGNKEYESARRPANMFFLAVEEYKSRMTKNLYYE